MAFIKYSTVDLEPVAEKNVPSWIKASQEETKEAAAADTAEKHSDKEKEEEV